MNKLGIISTVLNIVAIAAYAAAIIILTSGGDTALGTAFLCGGAAFMGVGVYLSRKSRGDGEKK